MRGFRLFPIGLIVVSTAVANAQAAPAGALDAATATAAAAPAPVFPKRPAELPPQPPKVVCRGNELTISANNSTLQEILQAVKGCTGAKIDIPEGAVSVRSFEELGPGPMRSVLDQLLSGTPYNYVILSPEDNPQKLESVMLSMRGADADKPGALPADLPSTNGRRLWQHMQKFDKPDPSQLNEDGTLIDPTAAAAAQAETPLPKLADSNPAEGSANGAAPGADASASAATAPPVAAPPVVSASPNSDPAQAVTDRIAQMQQMFSQRQQMVKQQNQSPGASPNN